MPFRFDDRHLPQVSDPRAGKIDGFLTPATRKERYSVEFFDDDGDKIGESEVPFQAGSIPVSCDHTAESPGPQPFQVNVSVRINGKGSASQVPIMLRN